ARKHTTRMNVLIAVLVVLVAAVGLGFYVFNPGQPNSVTVTQGAFSVQTNYFSAMLGTGQIKEAFVVNLATWNLTLSQRTFGESAGQLNDGFFQLSNGASADVLSDSQTNLVVVTTGGTYYILAPNDFQAFVSEF